ncbi:hypothetical protein ATO6_03065 [Oceanicola sp. 22II-s10i]|nr:hypothetical protein ATO6_03065 [Oceanicola sp. 22II-s10i]
MTRRRAIVAASAMTLAVTAFGGTAATAQSYPEKPVTMVMPFSAGGTADTTGRVIAEGMSRALGQQFVVENRPGATGNISYTSVVNAPADGYEVLIGYSATTACSHALMSNLQWEIEDLKPLGMFSASPMLLAVHPSVPAESLSEFIEYARANPGKINYGSPGIGSLVHIMMESFKLKAGVDMFHIPYKGTGALMPDALSGVIQVAMSGPAAIVPNHESGKLRALAVTGTERYAPTPDIPTMAEEGVEGLDTESWYGLFVRSDTPQEIVDTLAAGLKTATEDPQVLERAETAGVPIRYLTPAEMGERVQKEVADCRETIEKAGITAQ